MPELTQYTPWVVRDTTKEATDSLVSVFGESPIAFYSRKDAETFVRTCYSQEYAKRLEVVHIDEVRGGSSPTC